MIHKEEIVLNKSIYITGHVLDVQVVGYKVYVWFLVDSEVMVEIANIGTGISQTQTYSNYFKTLQTPDGLVHHIFIY